MDYQWRGIKGNTILYFWHEFWDNFEFFLQILQIFIDMKDFETFFFYCLFGYYFILFYFISFWYIVRSVCN